MTTAQYYREIRVAKQEKYKEKVARSKKSPYYLGAKKVAKRVKKQGKREWGALKKAYKKRKKPKFASLIATDKEYWAPMRRKRT